MCNYTNGRRCSRAMHAATPELLAAAWCIVSSCSPARVRNYECNRARMPMLQRFDAVDGRDAARCEHINNAHRLNTDRFMQRLHTSPGKVGCNLSHQLLWMRIASTGGSAVAASRPWRWYFICEDDVRLGAATDLHASLHAVAAAAEAAGSHYVRVEEARAKYVDVQRKQLPVCSVESVGAMRPLVRQSGAAAYLLDSTGASALLADCPFDEPLDMRCVPETARPMYVAVGGVRMIGATTRTDTASALGSLIYGIEASVDVDLMCGEEGASSPRLQTPSEPA